MTLNEIENYSLLKPGAYIDYPFGPDVTVVKIKAPSQEKGRIFVQLFMLRGEPNVTLNCEMMRGEMFPDAVKRGYHCPPVQQPYFNTVTLDGTVPDDILVEMIDHAYEVAVGKLPKKYQRELIEGF